MSQTIRRKAPGARKVAARQGQARKVSAARAKTGSAFDSFLSALPFTEEQLHRIFVGTILAFAVTVAWIIASMAGLPALAGQKLAAVATDAGFAVHRVDVRGVNRLNELKVYEKVLAEREAAMPTVDLERLRADLLQLSWVEDARVSRQLPDTLVIDIVERKPHAVLRKADKLVLIDAQGIELEPVSALAAKGRLVISGTGAGAKVADLNTLLDAAPALRPQVAEAEWVGNRRWNIKFTTSQVLALPEGTKQSANALITFARLDGVNRLIGGRVAAFDMRAGDRFYLRVPGRADAQARAAAAAAAAKAEALAARAEDGADTGDDSDKSDTGKAAANKRTAGQSGSARDSTG